MLRRMTRVIFSSVLLSSSGALLCAHVRECVRACMSMCVGRPPSPPLFLYLPLPLLSLTSSLNYTLLLIINRVFSSLIRDSIAFCFLIVSRARRCNYCYAVLNERADNESQSLSLL